MKDIMLTTIDYIPGVQFEVIGIVIAAKILWFRSKNASSKALIKLKEEASLLGADAVVGIRPDTTSTGSQCYIGTSVRFKK